MPLFALALLVVTSLAGANADCACVATASGGTLNIRSCGSTSCSIVRTEGPGVCYTYLGTTSGWYHLRDPSSPSTELWASSDYMSISNRCGGLYGDGTCIPALCSGQSSNVQRGCDSFGCGNYLASRGTRDHNGYDIRCTAMANIHAPFSGDITRHAPPYGNGQCCDDGYELIADGQWSGLSAKVFYASPSMVGSHVTQGQVVGYHLGLTRTCAAGACYSSGMTDHSHIEIKYGNNYVDPASWLFC